MKTILVGVVFVAIVLLGGQSFAAIFWTNWLPVGEVDSLNGEGAFITLSGYVNATCDQNRIYFKDDDLGNYRESIAILLSALHSGAEVRLEINDSNGSCLSDRVMIRK